MHHAHLQYIHSCTDLQSCKVVGKSYLLSSRKMLCCPSILLFYLQAVQLANTSRQAQEEAQRSSEQAEGADPAKPMRRLWDDIYTISYSRSTHSITLAS